MEENKNSDQVLKQIKKAHVPSHLFSKIEAKIMASQADLLPGSWKVAASFAFIVLLTFNSISLIYNLKERSLNSKIESVAEGIRLTESNQLYHD